MAIKVPHPEMESDPSFADRFRREVEIGELLDHPGIIKVIADPDRTGLYMVMEWFDGKTLREILKEERKLAPERAVAYCRGNLRRARNTSMPAESCTATSGRKTSWWRRG